MVDISEIEYECDGQRLVGQLAVPDGSGQRPGVLVAHEGPGIDANAIAAATDTGFPVCVLVIEPGGN